jgi:uncharacterized membrane protein
MKVLSIIAAALSGIGMAAAGALIPFCVTDEVAILMTCVTIVLCFFVAFSVLSIIHAFSKK